MTETQYGPVLPISQEIHQEKYRSEGETFKEAMTRVADPLSDNEEHFNAFRKILYTQRFLPGGRIQSDIGSPRSTTAFNCFVAPTIEDSMESIMSVASYAAITMKKGGGIGYDFSTLRPHGALITSLDSRSSGPISFMDIYDAVCSTIRSAGHRRGAQMGVLRVDHPDIEEFVTAKTNTHRLTNFNISVGITDEFMKAVKEDGPFDLVFDGRVYKTIRAKYLWDKILRTTWDWAEPGVLFIDRMNDKNNLWYCETIAATNPCGEQPLPPDGACLLGSFNLTKYVIVNPKLEEANRVGYGTNLLTFNWDKLVEDIPHVVRAMDNVIDKTEYPLPSQKLEAESKRRMGLGVTGLANAVEAVTGSAYGSEEFLAMTEQIMSVIRDEVYKASIELAKEKGPFPLFDKERYGGTFYRSLPESIRESIIENGIRNSHLLSIAPTGTISLSADNVSSGIEPVFSHHYDRIIQTFDGPKTERVEDYGYRVFGVAGKTAGELEVEDHVNVLNTVSKYVDSACSKTCNVGDDVSWDRFKNVYMQAYDGGASGITTFRAAGKRAGILTASKDEEVTESMEGAACYIDPTTGLRTCE